MAKAKSGAKTKSSKSSDGGENKGESAYPSARTVRRAAKNARSWLSDRRDYYGAVARRTARRGAPELASHLRGDMMARQDPEGSWNEGDLLETAETLWQLLDLGTPPETPAVQRGMDWLLDQRDLDGAYGEGCTPARHEQGICEHYITGFFSPGPAEEAQEVWLPTGQSITSDASARLLASERSLRSVLRVDARHPKAADSVSGLRSVPLYLEYGDNFTPALLVGAIQALAFAPTTPGELTAGLDTLAGAQEDDSTWPNVEYFFVLEALLDARDQPTAKRLLKSVVPRLLETQLNSGAWGRSYQAAQTWIAVQVLETVGDILADEDMLRGSREG